MAKALVLYYSSYGHIETMAGAVAQGARDAGGRGDDQASARAGAGRGPGDDHYLLPDHALPPHQGRHVAEITRALVAGRKAPQT